MTKDNKSSSKKPKEKTKDSLFKTLPSLATQTLIKAAGQSTNLFDKLLKAPEYMEQAGKAGSYLKDLREVAGLTIEDLGIAIDLENYDVLSAIEEGRSPITLDILFRLASFYSRNDPISFAMEFSRNYAPWLWQILRFTGAEKLLITVEREMKFVNIYRSRDNSRNLSDEEFDKVIGFTQKAFDMALELVYTLPSEAEKADEKSKKQDSEQQRAKPSNTATEGNSSDDSSPKSKAAPERKQANNSTVKKK